MNKEDYKYRYTMIFSREISNYFVYNDMEHFKFIRDIIDKDLLTYIRGMLKKCSELSDEELLKCVITINEELK